MGYGVSAFPVTGCAAKVMAGTILGLSGLRGLITSIYFIFITSIYGPLRKPNIISCTVVSTPSDGLTFSSYGVMTILEKNLVDQGEGGLPLLCPKS